MPVLHTPMPALPPKRRGVSAPEPPLLLRLKKSLQRSLHWLNASVQWELMYGPIIGVYALMLLCAWFVLLQTLPPEDEKVGPGVAVFHHRFFPWGAIDVLMPGLVTYYSYKHVPHARFVLDALERVQC